MSPTDQDHVTENDVRVKVRTPRTSMPEMSPADQEPAETKLTTRSACRSEACLNWAPSCENIARAKVRPPLRSMPEMGPIL